MAGGLKLRIIAQAADGFQQELQTTRLVNVTKREHIARKQNRSSEVARRNSGTGPQLRAIELVEIDACWIWSAFGAKVSGVALLSTGRAIRIAPASWPGARWRGADRSASFQRGRDVERPFESGACLCRRENARWIYSVSAYSALTQTIGVNGSNALAGNRF
jgi:hypothetical protein